MGRDKASLEFRGRTFLEIAVASLREVVREVIIVGGDSRPDAVAGVQLYPDIFTESGPLGGIHAALTQANPASVFIVSCDLPLVNAPLIRSILAGAAQDVTVPRVGGRIQPLCGLYRQPFLPVAEEYLTRGEYRMLRVLADPRVRMSIVEMNDDAVALTNINTPEDFRRLLEGSPQEERGNR
jgi:molybdopterin-guanine dinucleotide biosynthesis protein A